MAHLSLSLLGPFQVTLDGLPVTGFESNKVRALLAYLAVEADRPHGREVLAGLLWPDWPDRAAISNLRHALANLRQAIGDRHAQPPFLLITRETIQFNTASDYDLALAGLQDLPGLAVDRLGQAVAAYHGSFLEGFSCDSAPFEEWVLYKREQTNRQVSNALRRLSAHYEVCGEYERAIAYARKQLELEPWDEDAHRQVMRALAFSGQRSAALAQYDTCCRLLKQELGVEPARETTALYNSIRDETLVAVSAMRPSAQAVLEEEPPAPGEPPFKGLHCFEEADADLFFGREELTAKLVGRVCECLALDTACGRFLTVIGASGSGKSSIVRAGLVPALKRGLPLSDGALPPEGSTTWPVHVITPTTRPLEALAVSLTREAASVTAAATLMDDLARDPRSLHLAVLKLLSTSSLSLPLPGSERQSGGASHLLLVVDQFEELFSLCRSETERKAFVDNLLYAAAPSPVIKGEGWAAEGDGPTIVVITLRADFYAHCAPFENLRQAVCQRQEYIGAMSALELRRAIEEPAKRGRWAFEPGLVDLLLRDAGDEPGALPLLSHALLETWRRRRGRTLTLAGYGESGGVRGAIAKTAETIFNRLAPDQQAVARNIFLRLTELGEGTQDTCRRAALAELVPRPEDTFAVEAVLKTLADARLITTAEGTAQVAHEALIREWTRLREWLNENREGLRLHRHLTEAAQEWDRLNRDVGALYRGVRLAQALEWAGAHADDLNVLERAFLDASNWYAEHEAAEREAQRQRELEAARKLAQAERLRAEEQTRSTQRLRQRAVFLTIALVVAGALAVAASVFARQANEKARVATARELALAALNNLGLDPERSILLGLQSATAWSLAGQPMPYDLQETLHLAIQASRARLTWPAGGEEILYVGFTPGDDQPRAVTGDIQQKKVRVWDPAANQVLLALPGLVSRRTHVAFSPDGKLLAIPGEGNTIKIWEVASGQEQLTLSGHTDEVYGSGFSPDGRLLASYGPKEEIIWDLASGQKLLVFNDPCQDDSSVTFSPDGKYVAFATAAARVAQVREVASGRAALSLDLGLDVTNVAFSPDGTLVAAAGRGNNYARVWNILSGQVITVSLPTAAAQTEALAFSPSGKWLAIGTHLAEVPSGKDLYDLLGQKSISHLAFKADGTRLITASYDGTAKIWDLTPSHEVLTLWHNGPVFGLAFSPDGKRLATAGGGPDRLAIIWDVASGKVLRTLAGHTDTVFSVAFSPAPPDGSTSGKWLATASGDLSVIVWDAESGKVMRRLTGHSAENKAKTTRPTGVVEVAFSPQCTLTRCPLAAVGMDGQLIVWDAVTGQTLFTYQDQGGGLKSLAFSPDGKTLAVGNTGDPTKSVGAATILDATSGQELRSLPGDMGWVFGLAFSPDGKRLATTYYSGLTKVWDVATGKALVSLNGPPNYAVAFSPDGTCLATNGGEARLWDAGSGLPQLSFNTLTGWAVTFSPDGKYLATAHFDGSARLYVVQPEDLLALARSRVTRSLSTEECQKYLHVETCPAKP